MFKYIFLRVYLSESNIQNSFYFVLSLLLHLLILQSTTAAFVLLNDEYLLSICSLSAPDTTAEHDLFLTGAEAKVF